MAEDAAFLIKLDQGLIKHVWSLILYTFLITTSRATGRHAVHVWNFQPNNFFYNGFSVRSSKEKHL